MRFSGGWGQGALETEHTQAFVHMSMPYIFLHFLGIFRTSTTACLFRGIVTYQGVVSPEKMTDTCDSVNLSLETMLHLYVMSPRQCCT